MDDVTEAYRGTKNADDPSRREKYFLLVSKYVDQNGDTINVPVYINEKGAYNRVFIDTNKVATVYGKIDFRKYIQTQINKGNLVRIKNRSNQTSESTSPINADYGEGASKGSIRNSDPNVNKNSKAAEEGPFKLPVEAADADKLSAAEYNRLVTKKPIKVSKQEMAMLRSQRKSKYTDTAEYEIPVIDIFRIGDYRVVNNGYFYYVRNTDQESFSVVMKKRIVSDATWIAREVLKNEDSSKNERTGTSAVSEGRRPGNDRSGNFSIGDGRELRDNDQGNEKAKETQQGVYNRQSNLDSRTGLNQRNAKNKLPVAEDTSTQALLVDDGKDPNIRYKLPVDSEGYDTTNLHWAIENEIISEEDQARFWEAIAEISKRKYTSFARTKNGVYIIENGTKMMFTDGDFKAPTLSKIIDFCYDDGHDIEEARRMIRNEAERTGRTSESLSLIKRVYGSWFVAEYDAKDYRTYGRENSQGKGTNSERASSESKGWGVRYEGTDSVREGQGLKKKLPVAEDTSPRSLLANALESLASDDKERSKIAEYKAQMEKMEAEEAKLRELNAQIKELSFAKGKRDAAKLNALRDEKIKTTNRINIYDKQLIRLEAAKPLQKVLERERKRAYDRAKQKNKEAMAEYKKSVDEKFDAITQQYREQRKEAVAKVRETSAKRDVRQKILNFKKRMEQRLLRPTDTQYVPAGLAKAMVEVCELINTKAESSCSPLDSFIKPALAVLHPIMTCTNGRWVAAPSLSCSQRPPVVKAQAGGLQSG